jgi:uncharacterized SAM-binding protein YcdF (DUF218 family)
MPVWNDAEITERLFVEHAPERADAALVFASIEEGPRRARAARAAEMLLAGLVPLLLMLGGQRLAAVGSEARDMARHAESLGVPPGAIHLEEQSTNTFENARHGFGLLEAGRLLPEPATVLLVSSPWHLGRVLRTARRHAPLRTRLLAVASRDACTRDGWTQTPGCRRIVEAEADVFDAFLGAGLLGPH